MATVSCGGTSARYRFIKRFGIELGKKNLAVWLGVSRSGYYDWLKREPSNRAREDSALKLDIQKIYDKVDGSYGSPRVCKELQKQGVVVSRKRVARLMQELGLTARVTRVTYRAPGMRRFLASGENLRSDGALPDQKDRIKGGRALFLLEVSISLRFA